jgi:DNA-binding CsgD family transcriptional regulator
MEILNNTQREILNLFKYQHSEQELFEIKQVISEHLFKKAISMADAEAEKKDYTQQQMKDWANEHYRHKSIANVHYISARD